MTCSYNLSLIGQSTWGVPVGEAYCGSTGEGSTSYCLVWGHISSTLGLPTLTMIIPFSFSEILQSIIPRPARNLFPSHSRFPTQPHRRATPAVFAVGRGPCRAQQEDCQNPELDGTTKCCLSSSLNFQDGRH